MTDYLVDLHHIAKTFEGIELTPQGSKMEMRGPALWLRNLSRAARLTSNSAPSVKVLVDVSLQIEPGEIFGLVGRNGSGKTTLIKILAGLLRPDSGAGQVARIDLARPQAIRSLVSYVSTSGWMGLEWPLTAEENIRFFASLCGMSRSLAFQRTGEALRDVDLWEDRHKYPSQLSNGMRQRVILARALLFRTPLLLLDEPTVGLDPLTTPTILNLVRGKLRERGQTIILTDHQSAEMEQIAGRIAVLQDGRIAMQGTPAQLLQGLKHLSVIELLTEEMNLPVGPPPALVEAFRHEERPGPLELRAWRIYTQKHPQALQAVLDWVTQDGRSGNGKSNSNGSGRVVFLAEVEPHLGDLLDLPELSLKGGPGKASESADPKSPDPSRQTFEVTNEMADEVTNP
jgi:ABC-type multidrug transport system ATPase subunit